MHITERDLRNAFPSRKDRVQFASAGAVRKRLEDRAAAERRQVGGPDSLVERVKRGEEDRPWWMEV